MCIISSEETERLNGLPQHKHNTVKLVFNPEYNSKSHACSTYHTNNNNTMYHILILNQKL